MTPRKASVSCNYNGVNASTQIAEYLDSFTYTDIASGASDSVTLTLTDRNRKWLGPWFPQKSDRLAPVILTEHWNAEGDTRAFPCGLFHVDDFTFNGGRPVTLDLEGVALPADGAFKSEERTQTYEKTNLREIGQIIADRAGIELRYESANVNVSKTEQSGQTDCDFYNELVTKYGLALKIYHDRLVVFSEAAYETKPVKATFTETDFESGWEWNTTLSGTYTGVRYQYANGEKDETITAEAGSGERVLKCNEAADNPTEARIIALAALNNANKAATTMRLTLTLARPGLIASDCVEIAGLGQLSGKYYVEKITHTLGGGYVMSLELRRVEKRFSDAVTSPERESAAASSGEIVKGAQYTLTETRKGYYTAAEAFAGQVRDGHPSGICHAGTYWIFNVSQGMINLSASKNVPGSWVNPN